MLLNRKITAPTKKLLCAIPLVLITACSGIFPVGTPSSPQIVGSYADNCASPNRVFTFYPSGSGLVKAGGTNKNFSWQQSGANVVVIIPKTSDVAQQRYTLSKTQTGLFLSGLQVDGQLQSLDNVATSGRTLVRCG